MRWRKSAVAVLMLVLLNACVTNPILGPSAEGAFEAGLALYEQGRYEDAIEKFEQALDIDPEHAQSYLYLGRSLFHLGRWLEAVSYLRGAYLRIPADKQKELAGELLDSMLNGALQLLQKGNFVNAIALLKEALRLEPTHRTRKRTWVRFCWRLAISFSVRGALMTRSMRIRNHWMWCPATSKVISVWPGRGSKKVTSPRH